MIVVDTNVVAYLLLPGEHTAAAEALLKGERTWAVPVLWRSEMRNILTGYLRRGALTFTQAIELQGEAEDLLAGAEFEVDSQAVFDLVHQSNCSAYDCEFVALALKLRTKVVTQDKKLLAAFPKHSRALSKLTTGGPKRGR